MGLQVRVLPGAPFRFRAHGRAPSFVLRAAPEGRAPSFVLRAAPDGRRAFSTQADCARLLKIKAESAGRPSAIADFIDGIGAYNAIIADRVLTVARDQRSNTAANVNYDTVTLSGAAQAILNLQSLVVPISTELTAVSGVDEGSPGNLVALDLSGQDFGGRRSIGDRLQLRRSERRQFHRRQFTRRVARQNQSERSGLLRRRSSRCEF